jgi:phosphoribosylformylglycinamidine (FGAM) synthase-like enzyme
VIGIVGIIEDVTKAVPSGFQQEDEVILYLWPDIPDDAEVIEEAEANSELWRMIGSSEFARQIFDIKWGKPPIQNLEDAKALHELLYQLADRRLLSSAQDISDGGIAVTLARASFVNGIGADVELHAFYDDVVLSKLFYEFGNHVVVTCSRDNVEQIEEIAEKSGFMCETIGVTASNRLSISVGEQPYIAAVLDDLRKGYETSLESQLAAEVLV